MFPIKASKLWIPFKLGSCVKKYSAYFILYQTIHGKGDIQFAANLSNFAVWRTILKTVSVLSPSFYVSLRQFASVCVALLSCDGNAGFIDKKCFRNVTSLCVVLRRFTSNVQTETVRAYFRGTVSVTRSGQGTYFLQSSSKSFLGLDSVRFWACVDKRFG